MSASDRGIDDDFVRNLTECQNRLYVYILSLMPDAERAKDALQETNIVMWRKAHEYVPNTSFSAWACKIAYYEVLAERRKRHRDRHLFNDVLVGTLASEAEAHLATFDERSIALDECLERLTPRQRERLLERYRPGGSIQEIARSTGESRGAVATALYRIRRMLLDCVSFKLNKDIS